MSGSSEEEMNQTIWNRISSLAFLSKWQKSQLRETNSMQEIQCLLKMWMNQNYVENLQGSHCNATWDGVNCWAPTISGSVVTRPCSEIFEDTYPQHAINLKGSATRICLGNGSWEHQNHTDYSECAESYELYFGPDANEDVLVQTVQYMLFFGSMVSLVCLLVSLAIFYVYRCLWCPRVAVHVQLMISLIFRLILMMIISEPFVFAHESNYRDVENLCKAILVLYLYFTVASIGWMFNQGLYLNVTLMRNLISLDTRYHFGIYCFIGWGVPVIVIMAYVIAMISRKQEECWRGYPDMNEIWILLGPIAFEVVINGFYLLNVLRILVNKIRNSNLHSDESKIKAAAKATAVLFPVLGINNLLLMYNPGGVYSNYFIILNTFFGTTQGIFVAIVYCFIDKDVRAAISRSFKRATTRRNFN